MTTYVPQSVQDALDKARLQGMKKKNRLRVHAGEEIYPVLRQWTDGFSVEAEVVPQLRGLVDLYDGTRHLSQCLIVASDEDAGEMRYEFKRATLAADQAPLDFYRAPDAPVALITQDDMRL